MPAEQRGPTIQPRTEVNQRWEEPMPEAKPYQIPKRLVWEAYRRVKANRGAATGKESSSSASRRRSAPRLPSRFAPRSASGNWLPPGTTSPWRIWRNSSTLRSVVGSTTTGGSIARSVFGSSSTSTRCWPPGRGGSTNGCAVAGVLRPIGWDASRGGTRRYSCCGPSERCRRPDRKSRMRREPHVRFREGAGVKFPRATRPVIFSRTAAPPSDPRPWPSVLAGRSRPAPPAPAAAGWPGRPRDRSG
jgi:hypothetical protein